MSAPSYCCCSLFLRRKHYQILIRPTERRKARRPIFESNRAARTRPPAHLEICMKDTTSRGPRFPLAARRMALLATAVAGLAAGTLVFSPNSYAPSALADAMQAQNLTEKVQQLPQRPVGFADIVEKVKPAVISVRVKIDRPADTGLSGGDDDLPSFPPGSPFERFFKRFGVPNGGQPGGHQVITGQG